MLLIFWDCFYSQEAEIRVNDMEKEANRRAWSCLGNHVLDVREENEELRKQLTSLVDLSTKLQLRKRKLQQQQQELLRREQLQQEMMEMSQRSKTFTLISPTTSSSTLIQSAAGDTISFPKLSTL